jgi:hypothetical protein
MRFFLLSLASTSTFVLLACGGAARVPAPPAPAPAAAPSRAEAPSAEPAPAAPASPTAETCEGLRECATLGIDLKKRGDASARVALSKACAGAVRSIDACAVLTLLYLDDESVDAAVLADAARHGCATLGAEDGEKDARAKSCAALGVLFHEGKGVDKDLDRARRAFDDACKLGHARSCDAKREVDEDAQRAADAASGVPGANVRIGSVSTNGVTVEQIACRSEGVGGLVGSLAIGKPFADKKRQLDGCAKGSPHKARVRWTEKNGRMSDVKVISGDDPSNKCIERVLTGSVATVPGTCAASVDLGAAKKKAR